MGLQSERSRPLVSVKRTCKKCSNPAIAGGTHCGLHGGRSVANRGMYHKLLKSTLGQVFEEVSQSSRGVDLNEELNLVRTFVARTLKWLDGIVKQADDGKAVMDVEIILTNHCSSLLSQVQSIAETIQRREDRQSVSAEQIQFVIQQMMNILGEECTPEVLDRIATRMQAIPWPDLALYDPTISTLQKQDVGERLEELERMSNENAVRSATH